MITDFFPDPLILRVLDPREVTACGSRVQLYQLEQRFRYVSARYGVLTAPAGMLTDFASIPRFVWSIIDPEDPLVLMPSIIHDANFQTRGLTRTPALSFAETNDAMLEAMAICGNAKRKRALVYWAVQLFGRSSWGH